jgi:hypothetical protein
MKYLNVSNIKKTAKQNDKRVSKAFLLHLDAHIESILIKACKVHNGGRKTLNPELLPFIGIKDGGLNGKV